jgi:hypothetical protein
LSFDGDAGLVARAEGALGAAESSTYATAVEQTEALPAASVVFAVYEVDELSATSAGFRPAAPNVAADPLATAEPLQSAVA